MRRGTRTRDTEPSLARHRLWLELAAIGATPLVAHFGQDLAAPGVVLATLVVAALVLLARLARSGDSTAFPRLPHPERGGRRAEVYRLSAALDSVPGTGRGPGREVAAAAVTHLRETLTVLHASAASADRAEIEALQDRAEHPLDLTAFEEVVNGVERYLDRIRPTNVSAS